jgi:putative transposase
LAETGIEASVGSIGDTYDNALAETINDSFKADVVWRRRPWRNRETVEHVILEWIHWLKTKRLLEPIGNIPPVESEKSCYDERHGLAAGAGLNKNALRQSRGGSLRAIRLSTPVP